MGRRSSPRSSGVFSRPASVTSWRCTARLSVQAKMSDRIRRCRGRSARGGARRRRRMLRRPTNLTPSRVGSEVGMCFPYRTKVTLADGRSVRLGKLVHDRKPVDLLTMNDAGEVEAKTVCQFSRKQMNNDHWIHVIANGGKN